MDLHPNDMMMSAIKHFVHLFLQPPFNLKRIALRATSMMAGVIPNFLDVAFGTSLNMTT